MSTFAERLQLALAEQKAAGVSQNAIETKAGLNPGYLVTLKKGERSPSYEIVVALADALGVRLEWLAAERGAIREISMGAASPEGMARAAGIALGYAASAIEAGIAESIARNDATDPWEILTRIRSANRVPAPGRLLGPPSVQPYAGNENEGSAAAAGRPPAAVVAAAAPKAKRASK